jgi:hypothetical protein
MSGGRTQATGMRERACDITRLADEAEDGDSARASMITHDDAMSSNSSLSSHRFSELAHASGGPAQACTGEPWTMPSACVQSADIMIIGWPEIGSTIAGSYWSICAYACVQVHCVSVASMRVHAAKPTTGEATAELDALAQVYISVDGAQ